MNIGVKRVHDERFDECGKEEAMRNDAVSSNLSQIRKTDISRYLLSAA